LLKTDAEADIIEDSEGLIAGRIMLRLETCKAE